jgi:pimeloyl-ACP methyl ester carboxylesterase
MQPFEFPNEFRTQDIATNGTKIYVRSGGSGPAVVLLHGYGETGDMWAPMALDLMRDNLRLLLPPFCRQSPEWPLRFPRNAFPVRSGPYRRSERPHWASAPGGKKNGSLRPHTTPSPVLRYVPSEH